jgi:hypothetical protein
MEDEDRDIQERQANALEWIAASLERIADVLGATHGKPPVVADD